MIFNYLKQPDDKTCQHTCLAMMIGETVDYVLEWFNYEPSNNAEDMIIFLAHHGIFLGQYLVPKDGDFFKIEDDVKHLDFEWPIDGSPALVCVESERFPGKHHIVFWDGHNILDPNPNVNGPRKISSYNIVQFWPIILTESRLKFMKERAKCGYLKTFERR